MSNFGTGQGLFGATSNQNKNQTSSTPGAAPAASASPFANMGANTTNSSLFGGPGFSSGAGNMPGSGGTTSGTTGGIFGTSGSAFGGGGGGGGGNTGATAPTLAGAGAGTGTATSSPFGGGGGLFGAKPVTAPPATGAATGSSLFPSAGSNAGAPGTTPGGLFGNTTNTNTATTGGPFSNFPKPAPIVGGLFGSGGAGPTGASGSGTAGGSLFSGTTNATGGATNPNPTGSTTPATTAGSNPLGGGLFGNIKPADGAARPAASSFFTPPTTATGTSTGTAAAGNSLFPSFAPKPTETSTPSHAPSSTLLGGSAFKPPGSSTTATTPAINTPSTFSLGGTTAAGPASTPSAAAAGGGLFGNLGATTRQDGKPEEKKDGASTTQPTFSLGGQPTGMAAPAPTTEKKDGAAAPSLFSGLGGTSGATKAATPFSGSTITPAAGQLALATTSTSAISVPPPSMLKGKSIEEIINRWSTELESHVRDFNRFATEVAVWDRALIENGNNLAVLYSHVLAAEREQNDIDQSLDHIEQQERELSATVEMYEKQMADILGGQGGTLRTLDTGPADTERDKNYMLATELHNHLDDLSSSLTQLIDSVNSMSIAQGDSKAVSADDPMTQIAQVLSNHLESLQWIDGASRELEEKVVEVEKRIKDVGGVSQSTPSLGGGSRSRGFGLNR